MQLIFLFPARLLSCWPVAGWPPSNKPFSGDQTCYKYTRPMEDRDYPSQSQPAGDVTRMETKGRRVRSEGMISIWSYPLNLQSLACWLSWHLWQLSVLITENNYSPGSNSDLVPRRAGHNWLCSFGLRINHHFICDERWNTGNSMLEYWSTGGADQHNREPGAWVRFSLLVTSNR